jgi:hypothetical protein
MMCRLSSWMVLMLAPWSVVSQYPRSVLPDSLLRRCDRISWSGRPYSKPWDALPMIGSAQDFFKMVVGCMQRWAHGSKCFSSTPLDQTDITPALPIHIRRVCEMMVTWTRDVAGCRADRIWWTLPHQQGRLHLMVWLCLLGVARWLLIYPQCVPAYKIYNTTHGTLLVLKICRKLVIYPSHFWDFDSQKFVVRTVNNITTINLAH